MRTNGHPPRQDVPTDARGRRLHRVALATQHQRIERVEAAVRQWDRGDRGDAVPSLTRPALVELRRLLLEELAHLQRRRPPAAGGVRRRPAGGFTAVHRDDAGADGEGAEERPRWLHGGG